MALWSFVPSGDEFGDKVGILEGGPGPRGEWRAMEDERACAAMRLNVNECVKLGDVPKFADAWFRGTTLGATEIPGKTALGDLPSAREQPAVAVVEFDRFSGLGKITWYPSGERPESVRVRPPLLIAKPGRVRLLRDLPDPGCGLDDAWSQRRADLNDVQSRMRRRDLPNPRCGLWLHGRFPCVTLCKGPRGRSRPAGLFLRWSVAPASRPFPGVRHPVGENVAVYWPLPGWTGHCGPEVLRLATAVRP